MDMMSNPGFFKDPEKANGVNGALIAYLKEHSLLTIINDYTENTELYKKASVLPALPHALIETTSMITISDYMKDYKNIKRKMRVFKNKDLS